MLLTWLDVLRLHQPTCWENSLQGQPVLCMGNLCLGPFPYRDDSPIGRIQSEPPHRHPLNDSTTSPFSTLIPFPLSLPAPMSQSSQLFSCFALLALTHTVHTCQLSPSRGNVYFSDTKQGDEALQQSPLTGFKPTTVQTSFFFLEAVVI